MISSSMLDRRGLQQPTTCWNTTAYRRTAAPSRRARLSPAGGVSTTPSCALLRHDAVTARSMRDTADFSPPTAPRRGF